MSKLLVGILSLVVGLILGGIGSSAMIGGATGVGLAVGLSSGMCALSRAAVDAGYLTPEQVDEVMQNAAGTLADIAGTEGDGGEITNSSARCDEVLAKLRGPEPTAPAE